MLEIEDENLHMNKWKTPNTFYFSKHEFLFLSDEMGWLHKSPEELTRYVFKESKDLQEIFVLAVGNSLEETKILRNLPKDSVWVLIYGDETWNPRLNRAVLRFESVIGVIRPYPVNRFRIESIGNIIRAISNYLPSKFRISDLIFETLKIIVLVIRQSYVFNLHKKRKKINLNFIPGYTNLFAVAFREKYPHLSSTSSLLSFEAPNRKRKIQYSFVGQRGTTWRRYALTRLKLHIPEGRFKLIERVGFGGTLGANYATLESARDYVEILHETAFVISPPGNYSAATFRWLESIICGAVPLQAIPHPSDPLFEFPFKLPEWLNDGSWERLIDLANEMSQGMSESWVYLLRREVRDFIDEFNQALFRLQWEAFTHLERGSGS